jgi:hypothetical protein
VGLGRVDADVAHRLLLAGGHAHADGVTVDHARDADDIARVRDAAAARRLARGEPRDGDESGAR